MADDLKKEKMEENDEMEEEGTKKGKFKIIIFILLFLILAGGAGAYFFYGAKIMQKLTGKPVGEEGSAQKAAEEKKKKEVIGPIISLEPFVFNMTGNQSKYAKVTVSLEVRDIKVEEEAKKMVPVIRDKILSIFATKAPEALMDVTQRNIIKGEIQTQLKPLFKEPEDLKAVYIPDIIIQ